MRFGRKSVFFFFCAFIPAIGFAAVGPEQPLSGPGGKTYSHSKVNKRYCGYGATRCWVFEPASPAPTSAPLVIFNHGWGGINPKTYGAWIEHIVRRGNIVVYPVYQDSLKTPVKDFLQNDIDGIKQALSCLRVKPLWDKCAVIGHSMGGVLAADLAAVAAKEKIPQPKAVMCVEPGKTWARAERIAYHLQDLNSIPADTLLLTVVGDSDAMARDIDAKKIFNEATAVPAQNKNYVIVNSDPYGDPPMKATHFAPIAPNPDYDSGERISPVDVQQAGQEMSGRVKAMARERISERLGQNAVPAGEIAETPPLVANKPSVVDALDYYGYWKLFDALCSAAFEGKDREFALGNTPEQKYMGLWSDGTPVKELTVISDPK